MTGSVEMYHPGLDTSVTVDPDAMPHHRVSGWLLRSEWEENKRQEADRAAKAEAEAADKPADKPADRTPPLVKPRAGEDK
jgi:hypothetical protein